MLFDVLLSFLHQANDGGDAESCSFLILFDVQQFSSVICNVIQCIILIVLFNKGKGSGGGTRRDGGFFFAHEQCWSCITEQKPAVLQCYLMYCCHYCIEYRRGVMQNPAFF